MNNEIVYNINKILISSLEVREALRAIHGQLKQALNSERMIIALLDGEEIGFRYFDFENGKEVNEWVNGPVHPDEETYLREILKKGDPVILPEVGKENSLLSRKFFPEGIQSSLLFPLAYKEKTIGIMNFCNKEKDHFSDSHIQFLRQVVEGLAIFIQNALLFEETKKRLDELTILYEMTKISTSSLNLDQMLSEVMRSLYNFFKFEALGIFLIDEFTKRLFIHPSSIGHSIENIHTSELGKGIPGGVAEKGEPILVKDVREHPRYLGSTQSILSEMCVPLKVGEKIIGVIDAQNKRLNAFSRESFRLFQMTGEHLAAIIENGRSEERYRAVVESALDGVIVTEGNNQLTYVNERLAELLGYPREELIGMNFLDYLDGESRTWMEDQALRMKRGEGMPSRYELNFLRKDGTVRNVEISSTFIKDPKGNMSTIAFLKDITEKRRMEEQLLQSEKLRAVGEMASGVAHDFNNALAIILGNAQLLLFNVEEGETKEALKTIEKVARESSQTVRRLLEFAKKGMHKDLHKIELNVLIQEAVEITKPKWKDEPGSKGVKIDTVVNLEEIPPVAGIASEMREVIANMITNSIEAMPEGGKIDIRTSSKNGEVRIEISDTGLGMTEEIRKKIFEPFFTTKPFTNTGLGLSMAYGIIKRFGGKIEVESQLERGATFSISLPVASRGKEEVVSRASVKPGKATRILVIDDEKNVRDILLRILTQARHQVGIAENGEEGVRLFKEKGFDIVLTDLGMPGMSGWEVCKLIKEMDPRTSVGMITGWGTTVDEERIGENGLDFIISKPFDTSQILTIVAETTKTQRMNDTL